MENGEQYESMSIMRSEYAEYESIMGYDGWGLLIITTIYCYTMNHMIDA